MPNYVIQLYQPEISGRYSFLTVDDSYTTNEKGIQMPRHGLYLTGVEEGMDYPELAVRFNRKEVMELVSLLWNESRPEEDNWCLKVFRLKESRHTGKIQITWKPEITIPQLRIDAPFQNPVFFDKVLSFHKSRVLAETG